MFGILNKFKEIRMKINKSNLLQISIFYFVTSLLSEVKSAEQKDLEFDRNIYTFHCVGHYYNACVQNGSRDPDNTKSQFGPSFEDSIKFLFMQRIQEENFVQAYGIFQKLEDRLNSWLIEPIIKDAYNTASQNFTSFAHDHTQKIFETYLQTGQFSKAFSLATFYSGLPQKKGWSENLIEKVREKLKEKIAILSENPVKEFELIKLIELIN